ncbi:MAG: hypothetical protein GY757_20315 [bacterium]|nr:hypothetical protein [bacterium]
MKERFFLMPVFVFLFLGMATFGLFGQAATPEVSLDDNPNAPFNGPWMPPFLSAEDEFGLGLPSGVAGFIGGSPTLLAGFYDSDVLIPGPGPILVFNPTPSMGAPYYVDAYSCDHSSMGPWYGHLFVRFSVDRATGGLTPMDASYWQAANNEQAGDIFMSSQPYIHPGNFVPLAAPMAPPYYGGPIPGGPAGMGGNNILLHDHFFTFGFRPAPPCPPITPGSHDNVDAYNEWPVSLTGTDIYFALHPASALLQGFSAADILASPGGALNWPANFFAPAAALGLDTYGHNTDSVDGLCLWDYGTPGQLDPGLDYACFTLAPGSTTLFALQAAGFQVTAGDILFTDFQGFFYIYLYETDLGVGNAPIPPLPYIKAIDTNVDALDLGL